MNKHFITISTALAIGVFALPGCRVVESDSARVDCGAPGPGGVDCEVKRSAGSGRFEACWDLLISCQNGGAMSGSACHTMAADASEGSQNMPVASFSNQESCDVPTSGKVENLKVNTL